MDILEYIKQMQEIYGDKVITTADKLEKPPKTVVREMFQNAFTDNKAYGGRAGYNDGQLVTPSVDGSRPGYRGKNLDRAAYKEIRPITKANIDNYAFFTSKAEAAKYKFKVQLPSGTEVFKTKKEAQAAIDAAPITNKDYTKGLIDFKVPQGATNFDKGRVKISTGEFIGEGRDKSEIFKIQNKDGSNVRYTSSGAGGGKRKFYKSIEKVKKAKLDFLPDELVKIDSKLIKEGIKEVTYKNKKTNKIVKYYKPRVGEAKETIPGKGTTSLKEAEKFIKDYYVKNPKPVRDPKKNYASKDVRTKSLKETDPTKAIGTKNYNYHHIRQIAGGVPLTSDDVMIINQRINSKIGGKFNEPLNRISTAIQKNNRLALEAMNAKEEGLALDYMKRVDDLNAQAEKIVNSAIDDLPKKYKSYVGFNQFTLPRDEYGLPISNEPMLIRKVGGMPVSKDAIDLTTLSTKDEAKFRKIVKQQAEAGKTGPINTKKLIKNLNDLAAQIDPDGCGRKAGATGGRISLKFGSTACATKAKNYLNQVIDRGIQNEPSTRVSLIKKILSGTGNFIKQNLSPKELFKLENLVGKSALYATAVVESGLLADDVLRKKEPINVAAAENFLFGNLFNLDADAERAKNLLKSGVQLSPAAQTYAQGLINQDDFRRLSQTYATNLIKNPLFIPSGAKAKADTVLENLKNKIKNTSETGALDYQSALDESEGTFKAKPKTINVFGKDITIDAPDKPDVTPLTNKLARPPGRRIGPMTAKRKMKEMKVDFSLPTYLNAFPASNKFLNQYLESIGETPLQPGEGTLFRMNQPNQRGLYGTQVEKFASGGLASLTDTIPPESGPMSEGLRSLYNNGRKL